MNLIGTVTNKTSGIWVHIPALRATYGPLSYLGSGSDYDYGDRVLVLDLGADDYIVAGVIHP